MNRVPEDVGPVGLAASVDPAWEENDRVLTRDDGWIADCRAGRSRSQRALHRRYPATCPAGKLDIRRRMEREVRDLDAVDEHPLVDVVHDERVRQGHSRPSRISRPIRVRDVDVLPRRFPDVQWPAVRRNDVREQPIARTPAGCGCSDDERERHHESCKTDEARYASASASLCSEHRALLRLVDRTLRVWGDALSPLCHTALTLFCAV